VCRRFVEIKARRTRVPSNDVNTVLVLDGTSKRCRIELEGWGSEYVEWVSSDRSSSPHALRNRFIELGELLAHGVGDPSGVTLIIAWDFAAAVRRSDDDESDDLNDDDESDDLKRGSRQVAGYTKPVGDGYIVILDVRSLMGADRENPKDADMAAVRRTLIHEAQHVIMYRCGSGSGNYGVDGVEGEINRVLAAHAAKVCDEHRAQWHAVKRTAPQPPTDDDVATALEELDRELAAIKLNHDGAPDGPYSVHNALAVLTTCSHFWTSLSYWAAELRVNDVEIADMPTTIAALPLWRHYAGEVWSRLQASLRTLPVEELRTSPEILSAARQQVAAVLRSSLETIGFTYVETTGLAGWAFYSTR
jgi:hypothetical protein